MLGQIKKNMCQIITIIEKYQMFENIIGSLDQNILFRIFLILHKSLSFMYLIKYCFVSVALNSFYFVPYLAKKYGPGATKYATTYWSHPAFDISVAAFSKK